MRILTLVAKQIDKVLNDEDESVPGEYSVEVNEGLTDAKSASVALDIFHCNVCVECLDDFESEVKDEQGNTLE